MGGDEGRGKIFLVINRLKGRVLKLVESQHEGFEKSGADEVENGDGDDKGWSDMYRHERQPMTIPQRIGNISMLRYVPSRAHGVK